MISGMSGCWEEVGLQRGMAELGSTPKRRHVQEVKAVSLVLLSFKEQQ